MQDKLSFTERNKSW